MPFRFNPFTKKLDLIDLTAIPPGVTVSLTGNTGGAVGPDGAGNINVLGDTVQGVHVNGNAGTNTETITMDNASTTQKGVVLLATNAEAIAGTDTAKAITADDLKAKLGTQTQNGLAYGGSTTGAVNWLANATNGQIAIGSTGAAPVLANITSTDGTVTITNGAGTINLSVTNETVGTGQTIGAVTADIITIPLGAVAGTFQFEARVKGFESTGPAGAGYNIYATFTTTGIVATLVGNEVVFNEDVTLATADAYFTPFGNNAVLQVLGVAGLTINWSAEAEKT